MNSITKEKLMQVLVRHQNWLIDSGNGVRANLSRANLSRADLSGANLSRADLSGADLSGADLSGANLSGAGLSRANLSRADLSRANLSGADLSRADLSGADLSGADLSRAGLSGANLSEVQNKLIITFSAGEHFAYYCDGYIKIGCLCHPMEYWGERVADIGVREGYSEQKIKLYSAWITLIAQEVLS